MIDWQDKGSTDSPTFRNFVAKVGDCVIELYGYDGERMYLELLYSRHLLQSDTDAAKDVAESFIRQALERALAALGE